MIDFVFKMIDFVFQNEKVAEELGLRRGGGSVRWMWNHISV